jgi:phosphoribosylformylglycinamidine synthase
MLDNFCWGRTDDPRQMGALVHACQACYDAAKAFGVPFISGKDSLNNEFALDKGDVAMLISQIRERFADPSSLGYPAAIDGEHLASAIERRIRETGRLSIPATLLISAISLIDDVRQCMTPDLKTDGGVLYRVGGLPITGFELAAADQVRVAVHAAIRARLVTAVHDAASGWLPALAEMAIAGDRGARVEAELDDGFEPACAAFLLECRAADCGALESSLRSAGARFERIGATTADRFLTIGREAVRLTLLESAWRGK